MPLSSLTRIPDGVPERRAVLTGIAEIALNALWEAGPAWVTGSPSSAPDWWAA
ncbi:dehydrogenase [Arthrobacter sp. Hiyo8]|nr:dehydrogenase [Arthrobacter sp. Hiyo8]